MRNSRGFYAITLIGGVLALSTSAVWIKLSSSPSSAIAFYRLLFAVCILTPFMLTRAARTQLRMSRRNLAYTALAGFFLALHFVLWFESLRYTSVASSVFFVTLSPLFSYLGGWILFRNRLSLRSIGAGLTAMLGGLVIAAGDLRLTGPALWGDLLALSGAAAAAAYWLIGQRAREQVPALLFTYALYGAGALTLLAYAILLGDPLVPDRRFDWMLFFLLALIPTVLGHSLFHWLLRWLDATIVSVSILAESVAAALLAYLVFGEKATTYQWIGGALILAGVYRFIMTKMKENDT